jgi:hypothetical protein
MARRQGPIHRAIESLSHKVGFIGLDRTADFRISASWWVMRSRMDLTFARPPKSRRSCRRLSHGLQCDPFLVAGVCRTRYVYVEPLRPLPQSTRPPPLAAVCSATVASS